MVNRTHRSKSSTKAVGNDRSDETGNGESHFGNMEQELHPAIGARAPRKRSAMTAATKPAMVNRADVFPGKSQLIRKHRKSRMRRRNEGVGRPLRRPVRGSTMDGSGRTSEPHTVHQAMGRPTMATSLENPLFMDSRDRLDNSMAATLPRADQKRECRPLKKEDRPIALVMEAEQRRCGSGTPKVPILTLKPYNAGTRRWEKCPDRHGNDKQFLERGNWMYAAQLPGEGANIYSKDGEPGLEAPRERIEVLVH
jgi:hypothetical protein